MLPTPPPRLTVPRKANPSKPAARSPPTLRSFLSNGTIPAVLMANPTDLARSIEAARPRALRCAGAIARPPCPTVCLDAERLLCNLSGYKCTETRLQHTQSAVDFVNFVASAVDRPLRKRQRPRRPRPLLHRSQQLIHRTCRERCQRIRQRIGQQQRPPAHHRPAAIDHVGHIPLALLAIGAH